MLDKCHIFSNWKEPPKDTDLFESDIQRISFLNATNLAGEPNGGFVDVLPCKPEQTIKDAESAVLVMMRHYFLNGCLKQEINKRGAEAHRKRTAERKRRLTAMLHPGVEPAEKKKRNSESKR